MRKIVSILLLFATLCGVDIASAQEDAKRGFNLIVVGDPQPQTKAQMESLEREIIPQIGDIVEEYRAESELPIAILLTGDVVWDTMAFLPRVKRAFESLCMPLSVTTTTIANTAAHNAVQSRSLRRHSVFVIRCLCLVRRYFSPSTT